MASDKEKSKDLTQRRVYVLPTELVDRILEFQRTMGLTSEVEAARRLLDEALKSRDTYKTLALRLRAKLKESRFLSDAAQILLGHPQVTGLNFEKDRMKVRLTNGYEITMLENGQWWAEDENGRNQDQSDDLFDATDKPKARGTFGRQPSPGLDDDIPF